MTTMDMDKFFNPRSVAVVGASRDEAKVGHGILKNMLRAGFEGDIYPVNPKAESILGIHCYPRLEDIPGAVDLAVIAVPAPFVHGVMQELGRKLVPACVVISAGFKESGPEGAKLEAQLLSEASKSGVRIIGPNCLGIIHTHHKLNASFAADTPASGSISFFSQSGALCTAILDWSRKEKIGFSKFVSLGNKADIDETDLMQYLGEDSTTDVILGYLEGVKNGQRFMNVAMSVSRKKPVIIAKAGSTAAGARAASSHTGTLAGSEQAFRAAFQQCGIIRAESIQDLFDFAMMFASGQKTAGRRLAVVTNAGGPGIIATDTVERSSLQMAEFTKVTIKDLRDNLPETAAVYNPVDVVGDADAGRYRIALQAVGRDPNVDMVLVILTPQIQTKPVEVAHVVADVATVVKKSFAVSFMGGPAVSGAIDFMRQSSIPNYEFPERAVRAMEASSIFAESKKKPKAQVRQLSVNQAAARKLLDDAKTLDMLEISDARAREIVAAYGFLVPSSKVAASADEAVEVANSIGYPVVMKVASPDILHKSDLGAVKLNIGNADEVRIAFRQILDNSAIRMPDARIFGVSVQKMMDGNREVILGASKDPQFGPLVMFGLGGVYVEVMKDVSFCIAPLTVADADMMIHSIRSYPLLRGVRGEKPVDFQALRDNLLMLSQFVCDFPDVLEIDINPLMLFPGEKGAVAIDVRITVEEAKS